MEGGFSSDGRSGVSEGEGAAGVGGEDESREGKRRWSLLVYPVVLLNLYFASLYAS